MQEEIPPIPPKKNNAYFELLGWIILAASIGSAAGIIYNTLQVFVFSPHPLPLQCLIYCETIPNTSIVVNNTSAYIKDNTLNVSRIEITNRTSSGNYTNATLP